MGRVIVIFNEQHSYSPNRIFQMNFYKSKFHSSKGFTLIEILTVIAIIAILSAILVPTVSQMQSTARKTKDLSNMRQIINASQVFASQNGDLMPQPGHKIETIDGKALLRYVSAGTDTSKVGHVAALLAAEVGLDDVNIWISDSDPAAIKLKGPTPVLVAGAINPILKNTKPGSDPVDGIEATGYISFSYAVGLTLATPSQTPLIFSRLDLPGGTEWTLNDMYSGDGGHIGFAGGNVSWFEGDDPFTSLYDASGDAATSMNDAIGVGGTIKIAGN